MWLCYAVLFESKLRIHTNNEYSCVHLHEPYYMYVYYMYIITHVHVYYMYILYFIYMCIMSDWIFLQYSFLLFSFSDFHLKSSSSMFIGLVFDETVPPDPTLGEPIDSSPKPRVQLQQDPRHSEVQWVV